MKKTTKTLLSLLLVLVMALQFGAVAPIAHAEISADANLTVKVYAPLGETNSLDPDGSMARISDPSGTGLDDFTPAPEQAITLASLRSSDLTITPPDGYAVYRLVITANQDKPGSEVLGYLDGKYSLLNLAYGTGSGRQIEVAASNFADGTHALFNGQTGNCALYIVLMPVTTVDCVPPTCVKDGKDTYYMIGSEVFLDTTCLQSVESADNVPTIDATGIHTLEAVEAKDATCTEAGNIAHYKCSVCGKLFNGTGDDKQELTAAQVATPALTHDWGEPTYVWSDDNSQCTATRVCTRDASHKEEETVDAAVASTATCTEAGETTYTATFTNAAFSQQIKKVDVDALGHDYTLSYQWSADNSKCTASAVCANDPTDTPSETVDTTSQVTKEAACGVKGEITYTATFTNPLFATQTKPVETDALVHDWAAPTYVWSADHSECTAERVCSHGDKETETVKSVPTYTATCTADGTVTYTATFTNTAFTAQTTPAVTQAALGHDWDEIQYVWADDNSTVTATRTCKRDATHVETETVKATGAVTKAATAEADGERTFTSEAFQNTAFAVQTKKVAIPKADTPAVIAEGTETKWSPDDKDGMSFHLDATFNEENVKGIQVFVDGKAVPAQYIKITPGSVVVTVDPAYLATLTPGTHSITISFPSGHDVAATVTIDTPSSLAFAIDEAGFTKVYDGTSFDLNALKNYITVVNLPTGHKAEIEISFEDSAVTEIHNAGSTTVKLHLKSVKDSSDADVTSSFTCADKTGVPLTITKRKITVETRDDSKVYDGKAWTYTHMSNPQPIMTYTDPKLGEYARGGNTYVQTISIKYLSAPKNMGTYDNKAELIIREKVKGSSETGTDVTSNYEITYKFGKIKITDSKGNVPKNSYATGDESNIWLWIGLMAAAVVLVVVILVFTRKGKKRNDVTNP